MKCLRCNTEMIIPKKWSEQIADVHYRTSIDLVSYNNNVRLHAHFDKNKPLKKIAGNDTEETTILANMYVCQSCGYIEWGIDENDLEIFNKIEETDKYVDKDKYHHPKEFSSFQDLIYELRRAFINK